MLIELDLCPFDLILLMTLLNLPQILFKLLEPPLKPVKHVKRIELFLLVLAIVALLGPLFLIRYLFGRIQYLFTLLGHFNLATVRPLLEDVDQF